jgi:hypothetical protein
VVKVVSLVASAVIAIILAAGTALAVANSSTKAPAHNPDSNSVVVYGNR